MTMKPSFARRIIFLTALLAVGFSNACVWADAPTTTPADNPIPPQHGWLKECDDRIAAAQGKQIDILFIGDSITQNFVEDPHDGWDLVGGSVWRAHYGNRNALNLGVGSDGTEHILFRLEHESIKDFSPRVIVLLAGVNDMQYPAEDIAAGIKAVIGKCRTFFPTAKIVLMAILPNGRDLAKTNATNQIIQNYADNDSIYFLDLGPSMPPVGDNFKGLGGDHLHLTVDGYKIWAANLDPLLDKLAPQ